MAQINIEEIIDHLSSEMRKALTAAVEEVLNDLDIDEYDLFRAFKRAVHRKCRTWETVPDRFIKP
jgi:hypothetical protein